MPHTPTHKGLHLTCLLVSHEIHSPYVALWADNLAAFCFCKVASNLHIMWLCICLDDLRVCCYIYHQVCGYFSMFVHKTGKHIEMV